MSLFKPSWLVIGIASIGWAVAAAQWVGAAAPATPDLASNEGMFVDKNTFKIVRGMAKGDPTAQITKLGARPATDGVIIFRSGNTLYVVDAAPGGGAMYLNFESAFAPPG
jgi:hypothetical protein